MQKIIKVVPLKTDKKTGAVIKKIITTAGDFYSRACAYNNTLLSKERIVCINTNFTLNGPPFKIHSIKFRTNSDESYENIKEITNERKKKEARYDIHVKIIEKILEKNKDKVVILNFPLFGTDLAKMDEDDMITIVMMQIEANSPYITVPLFPDKESKKNLELLKLTKNILEKRNKDKKENDRQEMIPCMNTWMLLDNFVETLGDILSNFEIGSLMISCNDIFNTKTTAILSYLDENFPKSKLLIGVDVQDSSKSEDKRVSFNHILRAFNFDVTCREVYFPLTEIATTKVEKKRMYHDVAGAFFNEHEQDNWDGFSFTDFIIHNYPAECNLAIEQYIICLNFINLNKSAEIERELIMKDQHEEYINKRPYLKAFWILQKGFPSNP